jgi:polysaccharide export outer membrane protein
MKLTHRCLLVILPAFAPGLALPTSSPAQQPALSRASVESGNGAEADTAPNYCLAANDLVFIKVFEEDDLNSTLRITEDGSIIFPLIGAVKIGGLTVQAATRTIRERLDARYLVNPQVTITVLGYANRNVTVLGQVQRPGAFSMKDQGSIDLLHAIGLAGGFTRLASTSRVTVKRTVAGREVVCVLDAKRMAAESDTKPFIVLPGDTITVAERMF